MNNLLIFFALPIATIIISIAMQKIFKCPPLVAAIIFAIFLIVTFVVGNINYLVATIVYTILSFITASIMCLFCRLMEQISNNNNNNGNLLTISSRTGENNSNGCGCISENSGKNGVNANINKIVRDCWEWGSPHFTPLDDTGQYKELAAYFIKETSKTYKENDGGAKQRYSCSRNLVKPVTKVTIIKKAEKWLDEPKAKKGYYIDKDTVYNGVNPFNGRPIQYYTMVRLPDPGGGCG